MGQEEDVGGSLIISMTITNTLLSLPIYSLCLLYILFYTVVLCFSASTCLCLSRSCLLPSHLLFLAGNGGQYGPRGAAGSSGFGPWSSKSPSETGGCWARHAQETSPAPGGQPGGGLVLDLSQQLFHLMGGWPEWRVEDPWALMKEGERERERKRERERLTLYYSESEKLRGTQIVAMSNVI